MLKVNFSIENKKNFNLRKEAHKTGEVFHRFFIFSNFHQLQMEDKRGTIS